MNPYNMSSTTLHERPLRACRHLVMPTGAFVKHRYRRASSEGERFDYREACETLCILSKYKYGRPAPRTRFLQHRQPIASRGLRHRWTMDTARLGCSSRPGEGSVPLRSLLPRTPRSDRQGNGWAQPLSVDPTKEEYTAI